MRLRNTHITFEPLNVRTQENYEGKLKDYKKKVQSRICFPVEEMTSLNDLKLIQ